MHSGPDIQSDTTLDLILDKSPTVDVRRKLYELEDDPQWMPLFAETPWAPYQEESPLLVRVTPGTSFFNWAVDALAADTGLNGLLLVSHTSPESIAVWARNRLNIRFDGQRTGLLRYYDPAIWDLLAPDDNGNGNLIASAHYWREDDGGGNWQHSVNPEFVLSGDPARLDEVRTARLMRLHGKQ